MATRQVFGPHIVTTSVQVLSKESGVDLFKSVIKETFKQIRFCLI